MEDEIKKDLNDIEEDHRELGEEIEDEYKDKGNEHDTNKIAEDHREEGESLEDLKKQIQDLIIENAKLRKERDQAHDAFLKNGQPFEEEKKRDYSSLVGDIK